MFVQEHATLSGDCGIKHTTPCRLRLWRFASYLLTLWGRGNIPRSFCICLVLAIQCHMPYAICIWQSALWLMTFCFVVAHSVGEGGPCFLVFVELGILRHVAYAYSVLPSICSLCEGRVVTFYFDVLLYSFY